MEKYVENTFKIYGTNTLKIRKKYVENTERTTLNLRKRYGKILLKYGKMRRRYLENTHYQ